METKIFDGKAYAAKLEEEIKSKVSALIEKPKLASLLVGESPASKLFLALKQKAADRAGLIMEIKNLSENVSTDSVIQTIKALNEDKSVAGIMVQLPLPGSLDQKAIINAISPEKDADGMRDDSSFTAPVVRAVWSAIETSGIKEGKATVVGAKGFVGAKLVSFLTKKGFDVISLDLGDSLESLKESALIISATGSVGIIKGSMVKSDAVLIDVGSPKGDIDKDSVVGIASFLSPVPGGVGPLTIAYLMENLIQ